MKKNPLNLMSILGVLSLVVAACGNTAATATVEATPIAASDVIAEGNIRPILASNLTFQARGVVEEVNVKIGEAVEEGDVLIRLANAGEAEAQVTAARQAYDRLLRNENGDRARLWQAYMDAQEARGKAEKKWEDLDIENIEDRIEDAEDEVKDRQLDLRKEQEDYEKYVTGHAVASRKGRTGRPIKATNF
jgi:multidrug efflux pump subunit AcrA (membrane-fusion protein)